MVRSEANESEANESMYAISESLTDVLPKERARKGESFFDDKTVIYH